MIRANKQQLVASMFNLRRFLCTVEVFKLLLFLLSSILVVITCKPCFVRDVPNQLEVDACGSYKSSFDDPHGEFGGHIYRHSLENVCQYSSSFCFPSTVPALSDGEIESELVSSDTSGDEKEGFSSGLGVFRFIFDRNISCTLFQQDDYLEFLSSYGDSKNSKLSDIYYCFSNLLGNKSHVVKAGYKVETVMLDDSFTPLVEIKPSSVDWGRKRMYEVSKVFLTIQNIDPYSVLSVYDIYSSNSQFYSCNFTASVLAPGQVMSICLAFFPTELGLSTGQIVLQTSFGGFLILANGFSIESPYLGKPLGGFDVSNGRWRKDLSLFNPFDEALYVEEVTVWMFTSFGQDSQAVISVCCNITGSEDSRMNIALNPNDWFGVAMGEFDERQIALKPHKNWEIAPQHRDTIMELYITDHFEGKFTAVFGLNMRKSSDDEALLMIIPLEAEFNKDANALDAGRGVLVSLEALVPCTTSGFVFIALSVLNNAPYVLSLIKVILESDATKTFKIKSMEGLVLFPGTTTQFAVLSYASVGTHDELDMNCKLLVITNDTSNSRIEIPCADVIKTCSGSQADSSFALTNEMRSVVNYIDEGQRYVFISIPQQQDSEIKGLDLIEFDEVILRNWKSHATKSGIVNTILDEKELLFPMVLLGNYSSKWIQVENRSPKPVVMQLILNSAEIIDNCRTLEFPLHHLSSPSTMLANTSTAPTRYGFSMGKDALTQAHIHPHGSANLGPILFQPYNRCEWRSSALIRNNASGVEWLSLRGFGGSISLALLKDHDPVQVLDFNLNLPASIDFSSPDAMICKNHSCPQLLTKEFNVKNTGDLPLDVVRIMVSGTECGVDGFKVRNCNGFSLQPGESKDLVMTYHTDYSAATRQRDLELIFAGGVVVLPMKVTIPICFIDFCNKSLFRMQIRKSIYGMFLAAVVLYLLLFVLTTGFRSLRKPSYTSSVISGLSLSLKNGLLKSMIHDEASLIDHCTNECIENLITEQGPEDSPTVLEKQIDFISSREPEPNSVSRSSSCENVMATQENAPDSKNLKVRVGKEQGRRRRKKKSSGSRLSSSSLLVEVSSSQSGNSTPSSPISPVASSTSNPKRSILNSPVTTDRTVEAKSPFSQASSVVKQSDKNSSRQPKTTLPQISLPGNDHVSAINATANAVTSHQESDDATNVMRKMVGRAMLVPPVTLPISSRTLPAWACRSPLLGSGSLIAPSARAPGIELHNRKYGVVEAEDSEKTHYTYDIWGNHVFELALAAIYQPKTMSGCVMSGSASALIQNHSDSFFVRGPQTVLLMKKALLEPPVMEGGD